jgi:hypothetical protein
LSSAFFVFQIDDVEMKFLSANSISEFSHGLRKAVFLFSPHVAVHESLPGPKPTSRNIRYSVAIGLKADIEQAPHLSKLDL